jgi:hypothetical protein
LTDLLRPAPGQRVSTVARAAATTGSRIAGSSRRSR